MKCNSAYDYKFSLRWEALFDSVGNRVRRVVKFLPLSKSGLIRYLTEQSPVKDHKNLNSCSFNFNDPQTCIPKVTGR